MSRDLDVDIRIRCADALREGKISVLELAKIIQECGSDSVPELNTDQLRNLDSKLRKRGI